MWNSDKKYNTLIYAYTFIENLMDWPLKIKMYLFIDYSLFDSCYLNEPVVHW